MNITLPHAGAIDGAAAPHASAQTAFSNCIPPGTSTTQWQNRFPKMKPPHLDVEQRVVDDRLDAGDGGALEDEALEAREAGAGGQRRRRAGRLLVRRGRVLPRGVLASCCFLALALPADLAAAAASAFVAAPPPPGSLCTAPHHVAASRARFGHLHGSERAGPVGSRGKREGCRRPPCSSARWKL
jgi:hypothetical protein